VTAADMARALAASRAARHPATVARPTGSPLTGPLALGALSRTDPGYWHPRFDEPIYAAVYGDHREQLLAGLAAGAIGEQVPA
jgi:hypothetical protein